MKFKFPARMWLVMSVVMFIFLSLTLNVEAVNNNEEGLKTKTLKVVQENQKMILEMREQIKKNNDLLVKISEQISKCNSNHEQK